MDINNVSSATSAYSTTTTYKAQEKAAEKTTTVEDKKTAENSGAVYEKTTDRSAIIAQLKADAESRTNQMRTMVENMMKNQGVQIGNADSMWRFLAGGNFTVTAAARAQAQEAISEDGYYGVKKTSERILEFAKALTGGDASKAEEMRAAFEKGFKLATKSWGRELPDISKQTYDAVMKGFDEWSGKTAKTDTE